MAVYLRTSDNMFINMNLAPRIAIVGDRGSFQLIVIHGENDKTVIAESDNEATLSKMIYQILKEISQLVEHRVIILHNTGTEFVACELQR